MDPSWYFIALFPWPVEAEGSKPLCFPLESTLIRHINQNRLPYTQVFCFPSTSRLQDLSVYKILRIQMFKVYFEYLPTESKSIRMFCSFVNPSDLEPHSIHSRDGLFLYRPEHGRLTPIQIPIKQSSVSNSNTVSRFEHRVNRQTARPRKSIVRGSNYINSIIPGSHVTSNILGFHKRASSSAIYSISTSFRE
jgi:hypothetical protein